MMLLSDPDPRPSTEDAPEEPEPAERTGYRTGDAGRARARENQYAVVLGRKGMGKTTYARAVYRTRVQAGGSAVWIDRTGTNRDLPGRVVTRIRDAREELQRCVDQGRPVRMVVQLGWGEDHDPLWRHLYATGSLLLVLDDPSAMMSAQRIDPDLQELVELGRNREIDVVVTARRPPELHRSIREQADVAVAYRQGTPHYARQVATELLGRPELEDVLLRLPKFQYLRAGPTGAVTTGRVRPA